NVELACQHCLRHWYCCSVRAPSHASRLAILATRVIGCLAQPVRGQSSFTRVVGQGDLSPTGEPFALADTPRMTFAATSFFSARWAQSILGGGLFLASRGRVENRAGRRSCTRCNPVRFGFARQEKLSLRSGGDSQCG